MRRANWLFNGCIALCVASGISAISVYAYHFANSTLSDNPADWGVLGDYFGGLLNPIISIITLFFLLKTYLSQREEVRQNEKAAERQIQVANDTAKTHLLQTKISARYEVIKVYLAELARVTQSYNQNRFEYSPFIGMDRQEYTRGSDRRIYQENLAARIKDEQEKISVLLKELESYGESLN